MSDLPNVTNDSIVAFQIAYERISAEIGRDTATRRNLIKAARDNGVDTDMAVQAIKLKRKYSTEEAGTRLRNLLRSLSLIHMPIPQGDLFDNWNAAVSHNTAAAQSSWQAENAGYQAGKQGDDPEAAPYAPGSEQHALWTRAYQRGAADHEAQTGTQPVPAERTRRASRHAEEGDAPRPQRRRRANGSQAVAEEEETQAAA